MSAADKSKFDGMTAGAAVASVGVASPIVDTGTATAPVDGVGAVSGMVTCSSGHTIDKTNRRYRVVIAPESGTNALTGAAYYACTLSWTRPAGSNVGQD